MPNRDRLELRKRGYQQFEGARFWLLIALIASPFILFFIGAEFFQDKEVVGKFVHAFLKKGDILSTLQLLLPFIAMIIVHFAMRARLILDDTGIIYISGIPEKYQWIRLDWKCRWEDISAIAHKQQKMVNPRLSSIVINTKNNKTFRIIPWQWIDPNDPGSKNSLRSQIIFSSKKIAQQVEETPVMKFLTDRNLFSNSQSYKDPAETLNSNRKAQIIAGLFIISILYFIGDVYFGLTEYYVSTMPWHVFIINGVLGLIITHQVLSKEKLRKTDSLMMAVMFGLGIGLISYPLSIRANQWTDNKGLTPYTYELRGGSKWYPVDTNMPVLTFEKSGSPYWAQYSPGEQKVFELRQGVLGYTQINMAPIYEEQRQFYQNRENNDKDQKI
jgi:hypothetical protein